MPWQVYLVNCRVWFHGLYSLQLKQSKPVGTHIIVSWFVAECGYGAIPVWYEDHI